MKRAIWGTLGTWVSGVLAIASGGTGSTTAATAFDAIAASGGNVGSTTAGANLAVNATLFTEQITVPLAAAGWTLGTDTGGWDITAGVLSKTANATLEVSATAVGGQVTAPVDGGTYKVVIVTSACSGTISYTLGGTSGAPITGAGTTTDYLTATGVGKISLTGIAAATCTITSISVKLLTDATGDETVDGNVTARSYSTFKSPQIMNGAYSFRKALSVADDYWFTLPVVANGGIGHIVIGADEESATFTVKSDGTVSLIYGTANVAANADTDAKVCVGIAVASPVKIKNRLGSAKTILVTLDYN